MPTRWQTTKVVKQILNVDKEMKEEEKNRLITKGYGWLVALKCIIEIKAIVFEW